MGAAMSEPDFYEVLRYLKEIAARGKRVETRLTKYLGSIGFESGAQTPIWADGMVHVPTAASSLQDILRVIPAGWLKEVDDVEVWHGQTLLAVLTDLEEEGVNDYSARDAVETVITNWTGKPNDTPSS
jgi:hypothetical protein